MENSILKEGSIIAETSTNKRYRILHMAEKAVVLIELDINKLNIFSQYAGTIEELLLSDEMYMYKDDDPVYELNTLPQKELDRYYMKLKWMQMITEEYGPTYLGLMGKKRKNIIKTIEQQNNISNRTLWRIILLYLQSGCSNTALIDKRYFKSTFEYGAYTTKKKQGRPTDEGNQSGIIIDAKAIEAFNYAIDLYKSNRIATLTHAYDRMINKFYSYSVLKDGIQMRIQYKEGEYPTKRQFDYYCSKHMSSYDKEVAKTSQMEARNNSRLLLGDTIRYSFGPGDRIQMDEMEADISLQSSVVDGRTIGRPIVYAMLDTYSRMILAISISLDNNSVIGMTNCFLNLLDDKVEFCKKYGIIITPEMWPSIGLPSRILCDRGAEYTSHEATRIFTELGIQRELVSAGTGSLKGCVERWFYQYEEKIRPMFSNAGLITTRHDSKHHKEASLNLEQYTSIILNFVVYHNTSILSNYPKDKQMIKDQVNAIPAELWQYGVKKYGNPKPLPNATQFMYTLMLPVKAYINRTGINFEGLNYICSSDTKLYNDMIAAGKTRIPMECRIDPRDIGCVYYIREKHLYRASLNNNKAGNASFAGLTLVEWRIIRKYLNRLKREGNISNRQYSNYMLNIIESIIKSAKKIAPSDTSEMKKLREQEKHLVENNNSMFERLESELITMTGIPMNDNDQFTFNDAYLSSNISTNDIDDVITSAENTQIPYETPPEEQPHDEQWYKDNIFNY